MISPHSPYMLTAKHSGVHMPTGPKGQKRPADVIGNAVRVMRIATGEEADDVQDDQKAAKLLGARGGKKRAENMTPERRAEIARKAAKARWKTTSDV
jgi:hypothetical protein